MICPYCKESIQDGALKCRHCKTDLFPIPALNSQAAPCRLPFDWKMFYFSTEGRVTRADYFLKMALPYSCIVLVLVVLDFAAGTFFEEAGIGLVSGIFMLGAAVPTIIVNTKRCHDRDRSGWFQLLWMVPILNIWPFVELYFLRGTFGTNRFGRDPLA